MDANSRRLLFRIGTVGFYVDLGALVEIREQVTEQVDYGQVDPQLSVTGALAFRRTMIPVIDLSERLGLESGLTDTALVLHSSEGNWALLVDRVEGFCSVPEMVDHPLPQLLQAPGWRCFHQLAIFNGAPFLRLELSSCYAGGQP